MSRASGCSDMKKRRASNADIAPVFSRRGYPRPANAIAVFDQRTALVARSGDRGRGSSKGSKLGRLGGVDRADGVMRGRLGRGLEGLRQEGMG